MFLNGHIVIKDVVLEAEADVLADLIDIPRVG